MTLVRTTALLLLAACATLPSTFAARVSPADTMKAAVLRCDEARAYATVAANTLALEDQLTDDCLYSHSNGLIQTKKEFISALASGDVHYDVLRYLSVPTVRLYGGETAILNGRSHLEVRVKAGNTVKIDIMYTAVYVIVDAQWKLASYQSTAAPK